MKLLADGSPLLHLRNRVITVTTTYVLSDLTIYLMWGVRGVSNEM